MMSPIFQFLAGKLPILAGAGILGVSLGGISAGLLGATLSLEGEVGMAIVGACVAGLATWKRRR
jgi:hypothetical protein